MIERSERQQQLPSGNPIAIRLTLLAASRRVMYALHGCPEGRAMKVLRTNGNGEIFDGPMKRGFIEVIKAKQRQVGRPLHTVKLTELGRHMVEYWVLDDADQADKERMTAWARTQAEAPIQGTDGGAAVTAATGSTLRTPPEPGKRQVAGKAKGQRRVLRGTLTKVEAAQAARRH